MHGQLAPNDLMQKMMENTGDGCIDMATVCCETPREALTNVDC